MSVILTLSIHLEFDSLRSLQTLLNIDVPEWRNRGGGGAEAEEPGKRRKLEIKLKTKFDDIVMLDENGKIVDMGTEGTFIPAARWRGRKGGYEYKRGARGVGYYRTGLEVEVPRQYITEEVGEDEGGKDGGEEVDDGEFDYEAEFVKSERFVGRRKGYEFKTDEKGLGYYRSKEIIVAWIGGRDEAGHEY